jgi:hypothetical protein
MDPSVSSSFIPKKPLTEVRGSRGGAFGLVLLLAVFIFVGSLFAAGGAFLYGRFLTGSLEDKKDSLQTAQGAYDPGVIEELIRLDSRIIQGRTVLGKHVAPSSIFTFLANQTLEKVRFNNFSYQLKEDGSASIQLRGETSNFSTVALQSDQFGASKMLKDVIFSNIGVGETGGVSFAVDATIEAPNIFYSKHLGATVTLPPENQESESPPATTTPEL